MKTPKRMWVQTVNLPEEVWRQIREESRRLKATPTEIVRETLTKRYAAPAAGRSKPVGLASIEFPVGTTVEAIEKALIRQTLTATNGNKSRAAKLLGVCLKTLHNKLTEYEAGRKAA